MPPALTYEQLLAENERLRWQLEEATETIHAIRTGQVDALVVAGENGHELFTLKTADEAYRVFIETMNEGALTLNEDGLILYCNSTFATMVGEPISNVIGLSFDAFVAPDSLDVYRQLFKQGWWETRKAELTLRGADGPVPCQLSVNALEMDEGTSLSVILTDLTYQKETESLLKKNNEQLAQANGALEASNHDLQQFASVASHDLQEPLRKILVFAKLLKDQLGAALPAAQVRHLDKIIASSNRMKTIVADVLSYSRLVRPEAQFVATELRAVVNDVLLDFDLLVEEKAATVTVGALPVVAVNPGQIRRVFHNLIGNALKFSKPGRPPVVAIECHPVSGGETACTITVTDNGIGFDDRYADKVFSLFQRLNPKDAYEGSGIGLAIAKRIVDQHGGTLRAASREGVGSTFTLTLPLRQNHQP